MEITTLRKRWRGTALVAVVVLAALCAPVAPLTAQKSQLGYYRQPAIWNDTLVFVAEGDLWRVGVAGGVAQRLTTHPEEESRPAISPDGKMVASPPATRGPARSTRCRSRAGCRLATPGTPPVRHGCRGRRRARCSTPHAVTRRCRTRNLFASTEPPARGPSYPRPGLGRLVRRRWRHAVLHPPRVPGQPHSALQRRHGPEPVAFRRHRHGSGRAYGRLPGHEQDANALEGPDLLCVGPRRRDEHLVDDRPRRRSETAHEAPRLRGAVAVALERPDCIPAGGGHPRLRHRIRFGQGGPDHPRLGLRPSSRTVGEKRDRLDLLRAHLPGQATASSSPRADRCLSRRRCKGGSSRPHATNWLVIATRASCRTASRSSRSRTRATRWILAGAGERHRRGHPVEPRRIGAALGRPAVARWQVHRPSRQEPAALDLRRDEEDADEGGRVGRGRIRRSRAGRPTRSGWPTRRLAPTS